MHRFLSVCDWTKIQTRQKLLDRYPDRLIPIDWTKMTRLENNSLHFYWQISIYSIKSSSLPWQYRQIIVWQRFCELARLRIRQCQSVRVPLVRHVTSPGMQFLLLLYPFARQAVSWGPFIINCQLQFWSEIYNSCHWQVCSPQHQVEFFSSVKKWAPDSS